MNKRNPHAINPVKHHLSTPLSQIIAKTMMMDDISGLPPEAMKLNNDIRNLVDEIYRRINAIETGTLPDA